MAVPATQLLKHLEPAVRPGSAIRSAGPIEAQGFDQLLRLAATGAIQSGRQVEVKCAVAPELSASQCERMSAAADQAEAAGFRRALMLIDGRGFVLDVASRAIVAEMHDGSDAAVQAIDGAVFVPNPQSAESSVLPPPHAVGLHARLFQSIHAPHAPAAPRAHR